MKIEIEAVIFYIYIIGSLLLLLSLWIRSGLKRMKLLSILSETGKLSIKDLGFMSQEKIKELTNEYPDVWNHFEEFKRLRFNAVLAVLWFFLTMPVAIWLLKHFGD
jgi:hypothetical protein